MKRPSWEIRVRDPRRERAQRVLIVLLVLAVPLAWLAGQWQQEQRTRALMDGSSRSRAEYKHQSEALELARRRVAVLERGELLSQQASEQARQSIKLLETEVYQLQQELGTCKGIIGARQRDELQVRAFNVVPSADPQRFFFKLFLGRSGRGSKPMEGRMSALIRGEQDGKAVSLALADLSRDVPADGLAFSLRNFLAVPEGGRLAELQLPEGFSPAEIQVKVSVDGSSKALEQTFKWQAE